jgi:6-phosphogluconolactonase (cycloisomerase 2 family)
VARSRRLRVAMGAGIAALALLALATPAPAAVLLFQGFSNFSDASRNLLVPFRVGSSGALTQVGFVQTGGITAEGVAVRHQFVPGNDHQATVFVANFTSNTVAAFTVRSDGSLSPVPGTPIAAGQAPISLAVSPDGRFLYAANHISAGTITGFRIGPTGALTLIGSFATNGVSPWGLSVSPHAILYAVQENSGSVAAMRIGTDGRLTHLTGSPYTIGVQADQLTASDVSVDARFLFVTAGSGPNQGVWSFPLTTDGRLASTAPITRASSPVPIGVEAAPNNRHLYIVNRDDSTSTSGNGGVSGYAIGSNGSLTRILGASSAAAGTPFFTGGQQAHALDLVDRAPTFLFVGHQSGRSVGAFNVSDANGLLSPVTGSPYGAGGVGDAHFSNATTTTNASSIVNRDRTLLRFNKTPGAGDYSVRISASSSGRTFTASKPRRIVPVPGSGCSPFETSDTTGVQCTTTNVTEVRAFTNDGDNTVNAQNGFPEFVICGTAGPGFDTVFLDLTDPSPFNCDSVSRAPKGVGAPARPVGRSARVKRRVAFLRLRCPKNRQGRRCRGRVAIERKNRRISRRKRYSIRAGRRKTVRVRLRIGIRRPTKVRVLTRERARDGRPMTSNTVLVLKRRRR